MQQYTFSSSGAFIENFYTEPYQAGELSGFKFAVKDSIDIKDKITGFGNPAWKNTHPLATEHAICVELLLSAGAICVGKTITDEFTYSLLGENHFYGTPINPKYPDRIPGGSSSGSASSVACGLVDFALGTDTGGSIRVPASNCGIFGYRPTYGRISTAGVIPLAPSLDTVGVVANNFSVLSSAASVLLGKNFSESHTKPKIAIVQDILDLCDADVLIPFQKFLENTFDHYLKVSLSDIAFSNVDLKWLFDLYGLLHSSEAWNTHGSWIELTKPELGPVTEYNFYQLAKIVDRKLIIEGVKKRERFADSLQSYLSDKILCFPTTIDPAPKKGFYSQQPKARKSGNYFQHLIGVNAISSLSRSPQITIPIHNSAVGVSFLAGQFQDELLFNIVRNSV